MTGRRAAPLLGPWPSSRPRTSCAPSARAGADGRALEILAADAEGFAGALASDPAGLGRAIDEAAEQGGGAASVPASAFAAAACRRDGAIVACDPGFTHFDLPRTALAAILQGVDTEGPRLSAIVDDVRGRPVALAVARPGKALTWPLDPATRSVLSSGAAAFGVLGVRSSNTTDWAGLFRAWTFSPPETRLASALVRSGDLRAAAIDAGVSYETARETLAAAMAKTGARRQPEFVRQLAQLAFGDLPSNAATWQTLADAYGLTTRQGRLALLVASGATRATAADALGITDHSAKADLKVIYERCGVSGGAALGRIVAETDALARLASATDVEILGPDRPATPLRFIRRRRAPGRIAVEDWGPRDNAPVVVFHTPMNGRHLPRRLVAAMQARGLRPVGVERPGFGLTSPADADFIADANADLIDVLDGLGLDRVRLLGRSVAMPLRFAAAHPERVLGGVLMAATPPGVRPTDGFMATFIGLALDHPTLVEGFARMLVRLSSEQAILRLTERALRSSPSDIAALADPLNRGDWITASRQASSGDGFSREFVLHADGGLMPPAALSTPWTVLIGAEDTMSVGISDGLALWRTVMPDGTFAVIPDGGRLLQPQPSRPGRRGAGRARVTGRILSGPIRLQVREFRAHRLQAPAGAATISSRRPPAGHTAAGATPPAVAVAVAVAHVAKPDRRLRRVNVWRVKSSSAGCRWTLLCVNDNQSQ